ncbi:Indoleamine 2,3-dioxygenase [Thelephora ganbajun]|uniref:Indoleamine 2,3-dioxygenase n=1 Tax=Thelephora ganbajun TaxID=370292 RepID=A0ACB6ZEK3_THEGA|nr:Indoleamine 2,3-dioxygenase [Thelephora ganbajun]
MAHLQNLSSPYFEDGFLPSQPAVSRLPSQWDDWEDVLSEAASRLGFDLSPSPNGIPELEEWRDSIRKMPLLPTQELCNNPPVLLRARQVLVFLLHFYIHSIPKLSTTPIHIPLPLSIPLRAVSEHLGLPPICTYSDTICYNYSISGSADCLEDFSIHSTFSSTQDEVHFYRIQVMIEHRGTRAMSLMKSIISAVNDSYLRPTSTYLDQLANIVDEFTEILENVRADCDPAVFFNRIRVWFPGGKLVYDLEGGKSVEEEWMGSSAAQSSIIQALDAFLGIEPLTHKQGKYDVQPSDGSRMAFLARMRLYLPADHRAFLNELNRFGQQIREFILDNPDREQAAETMEAYNRVIDAMRKFRSGHIRTVALYVTTQQGKGGKSGGTGGTSGIPFLKSIRDQTIKGRME